MTATEAELRHLLHQITGSPQDLVSEILGFGSHPIHYIHTKSLDRWVDKLCRWREPNDRVLLCPDVVARAKKLLFDLLHERVVSSGEPGSLRNLLVALRECAAHPVAPVGGVDGWKIAILRARKALFLRMDEFLSEYTMLRGTGRRNILGGSSSQRTMPDNSQSVDSDAETEDYNEREAQSLQHTDLKGRGHTKGILLPPSEDAKKKVQFDENGCPVGRYSRNFVTKMGVLIKDQKQFPFSQQRYNDFPMSNFNELARITKLYFILEYTGDVPKLLRGFCRKIWINARSRLYHDHYLPHESYEAALQNPPKGYKDYWNKICNLFEGERWLKISHRNKANRSQRRLAHIAGRMSFAQRKVRLREELGRSPQKIECWDYNHIKKNKRGPNEYTEEVTRKIREKIEAGIMDQDQVFEEVLRPTKRGRVHGEGRTILSHCMGSSVDPAIHSQMEELRIENNRIREENRELKEKFVELKENMTTMERVIKSIGQYGVQFPPPTTMPYMALPQNRMSFQQLLHSDSEEQPFQQHTFGPQSFGLQPFEGHMIGTQLNPPRQPNIEQSRPHQLHEQVDECAINP